MRSTEVRRNLSDNFGNGAFRLLSAHAANQETRNEAQAIPTYPKAEEYLSAIGESPGTLFFHIVAIMHSPAYRTENHGALRQDWPRIPLPASAHMLEASAILGRQVVSLFDVDCKVKGISEPPIRSEIQSIAVIQREGKGSVNPDEGDLELTAEWGPRKGGVTMPGKGRRLSALTPPGGEGARRVRRRSG